MFYKTCSELTGICPASVKGNVRMTRMSAETRGGAAEVLVQPEVRGVHGADRSLFLSLRSLEGNKD